VTSEDEPKDVEYIVVTHGERLLVYTNSGRTDLEEAYAFGPDNAGEAVPVRVRRV
jgi:hypothetical protein